MTNTAATYEIDTKWRIVSASDEFCRVFRCTEQGLFGRDVRELLREDWRLDFRSYVARALVGVGEAEVTLPMVAPCGEQGWFKHALEPLMDDGKLIGYRATVVPHIVQSASPAKHWWQWRAPAAKPEWDADNRPLAGVS